MPIAVVPLFYFILPESAQWLISKNDIEGAIVCFRRVARFNGRTIDNDTIESFRDHYQNQAMKSPSTTRGPRLLDLFKTPRLRRNTLILFFKSYVTIARMLDETINHNFWSTINWLIKRIVFYSQDGHYIVLRCDVS